MKSKGFDGFVERFGDRWRTFISKSDIRFKNISERLDDSNKLNIRIIALLCLVCFALMYFFNAQTPFAADDFDYHYIFGTDGAKVSCVSDIIESMKSHYNTMNGRVIQHFLVQFFILSGKSVFNIVNSVAYTALALLIYKHCIGKSAKNNAVLFLLINLAVWTFTGAWGQTVVWLDGSVNYLWGSVIRLLALLPFRLYADDGKDSLRTLKAVLAAAVCFIAGATNENMSAAMIGITVLYIIYYRVKQFKIPVWSFTGFIGGLAGFLFMILAPANKIRVDVWNGEVASKASRFFNIPGNAILNLSAMAAAFCVLALIIYNYGRSKNKYKLGIGFIYALGSVGGALVMLASPYFPTRAWFGITVAAIIAVGNLIIQLRITPEIFRRSVIVIAVFWSIWCSMSCVQAVQDTLSVAGEYDSRLQYIEEQKSNGNFDLTLPVISAENEHSPLYGVADISENADNWSNISKARYYGLNSVKAE